MRTPSSNWRERRANGYDEPKFILFSLFEYPWFVEAKALNARFKLMCGRFPLVQRLVMLCWIHHHIADTILEDFWCGISLRTLPLCLIYEIYENRSMQIIRDHHFIRPPENTDVRSNCFSSGRAWVISHISFFLWCLVLLFAIIYPIKKLPLPLLTLQRLCSGVGTHFKDRLGAYRQCLTLSLLNLPVSLKISGN